MSMTKRNLDRMDGLEEDDMAVIFEIDPIKYERDMLLMLILDGSLIITALQYGALVTSANGTYHANGRCDCPARTKHCYHRAGVRLMELYEAELDAHPAPRKPEIIRSVERDVLTRRRVKVTRCDNWVI